MWLVADPVAHDLGRVADDDEGMGIGLVDQFLHDCQLAKGDHRVDDVRRFPRISSLSLDDRNPVVQFLENSGDDLSPRLGDYQVHGFSLAEARNDKVHDVRANVDIDEGVQGAHRQIWHDLVEDQGKTGHTAADESPGDEGSVYGEGADAASRDDENEIPENLHQVSPRRRPPE